VRKIMMSRSSLVLVVVLTAFAGTGCNCNPPVCTPGALACACTSGGTCNEGLVCGSDSKCSAAVVGGVVIADAAARGCEFVLNEAPGTEVVAVTFKNGATGTWVREAPRVAVTVLSGGDKALGDAVELGLTGSASSLTLTKASCVGLTGQRLSTTVSIH